MLTLDECSATSVKPFHQGCRVCSFGIVSSQNWVITFCMLSLGYCFATSVSRFHQGCRVCIFRFSSKLHQVTVVCRLNLDQCFANSVTLLLRLYQAAWLLFLCRLSLDQEDILTWKDHSQAQVLLLAALSAKWTNNDAIDRAVTNAVEGGQEVCLYTRSLRRGFVGGRQSIVGLARGLQKGGVDTCLECCGGRSGGT